MEQQDIKPGKEKGLASFSTRSRNMPHMPKIKKPKSFNPIRIASIAAVALICLGLGYGGGWIGAKNYNNSQTSSPSKTAQQKIISSEGDLIASIAKDVGQSVVSVDVESQTSATDFFGRDRSFTQQSAGTGFIISSDGVIVTNRHVAPEGTSKVSVTLADGTQYDDVEVIGRTNESNSLDVAFLKIKDLGGKKLVPVTMGDSSKAQVGDKVIAIGNALGQFQNTVTSGIISGYGRDLTAGSQDGGSTETLNDLFQTDAAINEGNSGGPLVNINGEVIGINTAVASGAQNIGFAIPINDVKGLVKSVLNTGELKQPYIGVRYVSLTDDLAYQYNLKINRGAYIVPSSETASESILKDSPAEKAGLKEKDVIVKIDNTNIDDKTSLTSALSKYQVGDTVKLTINRDGKTITKSVTLESAPSS